VFLQRDNDAMCVYQSAVNIKRKCNRHKISPGPFYA
jgi:hypothetical protein